MHPYASHREHKASHSRVKHVLKSGGVARPHHDEAADRTLFGKMLREHDRKEAKVAGHKGAKRYARGGKVKGHQTNIAIVVPHRPSSPPTPAGAGLQAGAPPGLPGGAPAPMMPPSPPGMPPGGPPMPMRARGGKVIAGEATAENLDKWSARAKRNSYARGGRLPTAGAATGVGRIQEADLVRGKHR